MYLIQNTQTETLPTPILHNYDDTYLRGKSVDPRIELTRFISSSMIAAMKSFTLCYQNTVQLRAFTIVSHYEDIRVRHLSPCIQSTESSNAVSSRYMFAGNKNVIVLHLKKASFFPRHATLSSASPSGPSETSPLHVLIFEQFQLNPVTEF
jgi:hypothetical protein